jgi:hypothetical protein
MVLTNQNYMLAEMEEEVQFRECVPPFGPEPFTFLFAIEKHKSQIIQNYNFACCFVWV